MSATFRAALSLFILIGFFVFALALVAGLMFVGFFIAQSFSAAAAVKIFVVAAGAAIGLVVGLGTVLFVRPQPKPGVDVTSEDAPELWALVTELSHAAGTRGPEQIRLVSEVNAAVSEDSRFLGLIDGPRRMYLGVPLLQGLSVTQLRAVLAHEFGHYSSSHTRLGPVAYRGWQSVVATMQQLHGNPIAWVLRWYAALYILMSLAMSRSQEREADRLMVQVAGRANAQAALREVQVIAAAWTYYMDEYVGLGWESDLAPTADGFFGGFERLLAARADELKAIRDEPPHEEPAKKSIKDYAREMMDSHPPIAERIAAMDATPDRSVALPADDRTACALIPACAKAAAATAEAAYVFGYRERLEWDDLIARVRTMNDARTAGTIYATAARLAEQPTASLSTVVALSEASRAAELVKAVIPDASAERREEIAIGVFIVVVRAAAVNAGAARWRMSWSGSAELVTVDGEIFDAESIAALLTDAATARDAAARLTALGVDITAVAPVPTTANVGQIIGGIADMKADDASYDVLILDTGLILAETPRESEYGGKGRLQMLVRSGSVGELVARHRFVPYASMASAKVSGWWVTLRSTITLHDGTRLRLKERMQSEYLAKDNDETFKLYLRLIW